MLDRHDPTRGMEDQAMPKTVPERPGIVPTTLPISQVIEANGFVFLAGQVGNVPGGTGPVPGGIAAETAATLDNVGRLLGAVGLGYRDVVKATVYLVDMDEFGAMNEVYRRTFPSEPPTRTTVGVARLVADYRIEIEVIAAR
jgi:2-iminobutanoate/2-iminopropanoate deaminase